MIVPDQKNLKVHFAALEQDTQADAAKDGGVRYGLFTAYDFIAGKAGIVGGGRKTVLPTGFRHMIQDSGLFTLMFGAKAGPKTEAFMDKWYDLLVEFSLGNSSTVVEVDCQKVLGVSTAWKYRERMRNDLPGRRIVNVFHKEDGQAGLDKLIEFSDYLAISVPELRRVGQENYTTRLAHYIKNRKPSIDIHLLGCTKMSMLKGLAWCTTSDSTTWLEGVRYGHRNGHRTSGGHRPQNIIVDSVIERFGSHAIDKHGTTPAMRARIAMLVLDAWSYRERYAHLVGDQE